MTAVGGDVERTMVQRQLSPSTVGRRSHIRPMGWGRDTRGGEKTFPFKNTGGGLRGGVVVVGACVTSTADEVLETPPSPVLGLDP